MMQHGTDFGGFMGATFELLGRNIPAVAVFVLVVGGMTAAGPLLGLGDADEAMAGFGIGFALDATAGMMAATFQLVTAVITIIASYFLLARFLESANRLPERGTRIWAYIGMSILSTFGLVVGFLLLIVPGVILMVRWSAASGYLIGARSGVVEALSESWEATRGHSWPIFFAGLVFVVILLVAAGMLGLAEGLAPDFLTTVLEGLVEGMSDAVFLAFGIAVYLLVHNDADEIAEAFE